MKRIAVLVTLLLLISACGSGKDGAASWTRLGFGVDLAEWTLGDGTRCVIIDDTKNAAITCDWNAR